MNQLVEISDRLRGLKDKFVQGKFSGNENQYSSKVNESLRQWRGDLVEIFAYSISDAQEETFNRLKQWGDDSVYVLINLDLPLDVAIEEVRYYREVIGDVLKDEAINYHFSLETFYEIISRFDAVVDRAVYWLSISYTYTYTSRIQAAEALALELSIPVIRISEKIGVLPLIGDIDTKRANDLMERALTQGTALGLDYLFIDLSGVTIIDTMVADQLFKVISALELVGIKVNLTGISPEIAITMVQLGIDLRGITTFATLYQAIKKLSPS
ncbi:hypothetical protein WQ54_05440 [Bacillus sp. SA1-12]|nr:hypothetical protein WQ54_05440 [Bacillus sp. SA1-12]